jgi:transposase
MDACETGARLATAPGVGPVTASAFVATIDDQHAVSFGAPA